LTASRLFGRGPQAGLKHSPSLVRRTTSLPSAFIMKIWRFPSRLELNTIFRLSPNQCGFSL